MPTATYRSDDWHAHRPPPRPTNSFLFISPPSALAIVAARPVPAENSVRVARSLVRPLIGHSCITTPALASKPWGGGPDVPVDAHSRPLLDDRQAGGSCSGRADRRSIDRPTSGGVLLHYAPRTASTPWGGVEVPVGAHSRLLLDGRRPGGFGYLPARRSACSGPRQPGCGVVVRRFAP